MLPLSESGDGSLRSFPSAKAEMATFAASPQRKRRWQLPQLPLSESGDGSFGSFPPARRELAASREHSHTDADDSEADALCGARVRAPQVDHVINEKSLLQQCNSPFVLKLIASYANSKQLFLLTEIALGGELFTYLQKKPRLPEEQGALYSAQARRVPSYGI